jgi:Mrp family chromosome partitioning ATPase
LRDAPDRLFVERNVSVEADQAIDTIAERIMRAYTPGRSLHVAVLGSESGEGISTISANLAVALSHREQSVVLIDTDLRNPTLHRFFRVSEGDGLGSLIDNPETPWQTCARRLTNSLALLPAGSDQRTPRSDVAVDKLVNAIKPIDDDHSIFIVDASGVAGNSAAPLLAWSCDVALVVAQPESIRSEAVGELARALHEPGVKLLGVILNGHKSKDWELIGEWNERVARSTTRGIGQRTIRQRVRSASTGSSKPDVTQVDL